MTEEALSLKPCPFCGSPDAGIIEVVARGTLQYYAVCRDCRARSALVTSERQAAAKWNCRK